MPTVPLLCGTHWLSQTEQYKKPNLMQYCMIKKREDLPNYWYIQARWCKPKKKKKKKNPEKLSTYKDLELKVSRMWKVRTKIVPVITGALGTSKKVWDQALQLSMSYVSHRATDHTNEHCTHHLQSAAVNHCDLLLRSGLTRKLSPSNS
jgi:hypothetical protein